MRPLVKSLQIRNGARPERSHKVPRLDPSVAPSPLAAAPPLALLERGRIPGVARRAPAPRAFPYRVRARQSPLPFTRRPQLHGVPPPRVGDAAAAACIRPRRRVSGDHGSGDAGSAPGRAPGLRERGAGGDPIRARARGARPGPSEVASGRCPSQFHSGQWAHRHSRSLCQRKLTHPCR